MKNVFYYGWLGNSNLGDETLFYANKRLFRELKFVTQRTIWSRLYCPRACILGGGTYINEAARVESISRIQENMPFIVFGAGVQNPSFWGGMDGYVDTRQLWNAVLKKCFFVGVRGPHSAKTLSEQGFSEVKITGDPVLSLADEKVSYRSGRRIGLNFGYTDNRLWGGCDGLVYDKFRNLIVALDMAGYEVSLFSVCPADTSALSKIAGEFSFIKGVHIYYKYTPEVLNYFRGIDIFVGMKLHSVILAHCAYTPSLMIEYRPKCADYMASVDLIRLNVRCDKMEPNAELDLLEKLVAEGREHQDFLFEHIRAYRSIQTEMAGVISDFVKGI